MFSIRLFDNTIRACEKTLPRNTYLLFCSWKQIRSQCYRSEFNRWRHNHQEKPPRNAVGPQIFLQVSEQNLSATDALSADWSPAEAKLLCVGWCNPQKYIVNYNLIKSQGLKKYSFIKKNEELSLGRAERGNKRKIKHRYCSSSHK